jgi:hypothetical protein
LSALSSQLSEVDRFNVEVARSTLNLITIVNSSD